MKKRGIILPAILVLISLLVLLALTRHFFSRQQLHFADILADKEQAYYAANGLRKISVSLLEKAFDHYNSSSDTALAKLEKADKTSKAILEKLIKADGEPIGKQAGFKIDSSACREYVEMLEQGGIKLDEYSIEGTFLPIAPIFKAAPSNNGMQPDANEINWKLILRCFARVKDSSKAVIWYREGRTISLQPPVVGKFSLFILEPASEKINELQAVTEAMPDKFMPVNIRNGLIAGRESKNAEEARDLIDSQGWVYFGESATLDIRLNGHCGMINPYFFSTPLDSAEYLSSKGTFSYYYYCDAFKETLKNSNDGLAPFADAEEKDFLLTTSIAANGSVTEPSPTLLLGRVTRSFPIVQGLTGAKSGKRFPFPMISSSGFNSSSWPCQLKPAEIDMIKENFAGNYDKYKQRMSFIYQEPFNSANFQILSLGKAHREFAVIQPESLPATILPPPTLNRIKINGNAVDFCNFAAGSAYSLLDDSGNTVFANAALSSITDLTFMTSKAAFTFADQKSFMSAMRQNEKGAIILSSAVEIDSDLIISKPLFFTDAGGMIICRGNITISAPVSVENQAPLTLISLTGNITLARGITVDASLVALSGSVDISRESTINGLVACKTFKADLSGGLAGTINYNSQLDFTSTAARKNSYRLCPDAKEYYLVE